MQTAINRKVASPVPTGAEDEHRRKRGRFGTDVSTLDFGQLLQLASVPVTTVVSEHIISSPRTSSSDLSVSGRTGSVDKLLGTTGFSSNVHGRANGKQGESSLHQSPSTRQNVGIADRDATEEMKGSFQMSTTEQRERGVVRVDASRMIHLPNNEQYASAHSDNLALLFSHATSGKPSAHLNVARPSGDGSDVRSRSEGLAIPVHINRTMPRAGDQGTAQAIQFLGQPTTDASPSANGTDDAKPDHVLHAGRSDAPRELRGIVLRQVQAGPAEVRVKVHPEGMGDILVSVQRQGDAVQVRLEGNQMQAVQWLSQQTDGVAQVLKNAGVAVQSVEVAFGQANLSQGFGGEQPSKRRRDDAQASWSTAVNAGGRSTDIRLVIPESVGDSTHVNIRV